MKRNVIVRRLTCLILAAATCVGPAALAQTQPVPAWQIKAGGHAEFDVASVRLDKGEFKTPSFAMSADDWLSRRLPRQRVHRIRLQDLAHRRRRAHHARRTSCVGQRRPLCDRGNRPPECHKRPVPAHDAVHAR